MSPAEEAAQLLELFGIDHCGRADQPFADRRRARSAA